MIITKDHIIMNRALVAPREAVQTDRDGWFVMTIRGGVAKPE